MNLDKKINLLKNKIERLEKENIELKTKNESLMNELGISNQKVDDIEEIKKEYERCIDEAKRIQLKYKDEIKEIRNMKKEYKRKFSLLLKTMK